MFLNKLLVTAITITSLTTYHTNAMNNNTLKQAFEGITSPDELYHTIKKLKDIHRVSNNQISELLRVWLKETTQSLDKIVTEFNQTVLHKACTGNDSDCVKIILDIHTPQELKFWQLLSVNHTVQLWEQDRGSSAFDEAIKSGYIEFVKSFIAAAGTQVLKLITMKNIHDDTPVHIAANYGNHEILKLILNVAQNADQITSILLTTNNAGCNPLHRAAYGGHLKACKLLIEAARMSYLSSNIINAKDKNHHTAKDWAHCGLENAYMRLRRDDRIFEYLDVILTLNQAMGGTFN